MNISGIMAALHRWYTDITSRHLFSWSGYLADDVITYFFYIAEWHRSKHVLRQFGLMQGIPLTSYIDFDFHSIDRYGWPQFDWRLYHEHYLALWEVRGDHIVIAEPIKPHMDYHALYMTWYCHITCHFITPMDDFRPMRYQATALFAHLLVCITLILCTYCIYSLFQQIIIYHFIWQIETMTSIISQGGHALEDFDSDACRTGIIDIIHMAIDVMCIIWEDYRIPHIEYGGDRSPTQLTVARLPLVWG